MARTIETLSTEAREDYIARIAEHLREESYRAARDLYGEIVERFGFVRIADEVYGAARKAAAAS